MYYLLAISFNITDRVIKRMINIRKLYIIITYTCYL